MVLGSTTIIKHQLKLIVCPHIVQNQVKIGTLDQGRGAEEVDNKIHRLLTTTYSRPLKFPNQKNIRGFLFLLSFGTIFDIKKVGFKKFMVT